MGRKKTNFRLLGSSATIQHNSSSKNLFNLPKPRFLVLSRDHPTETMSDVTYSLINNVINNVAGKVNSIKKLMNGIVLIETKTESQSTKLLKLKYFPPKMPVKIIPHRWLNYSRGVIISRDLIGVSVEKLREELRAQFVTDVKQLSYKCVAKDGESILQKPAFVLTFSLPTLPNVINVANIKLTPLPYVPRPKMCYKCYKYGHISRNCLLESKACSNCTEPGHESKDCTNCVLCANCSQQFTSGHKPCLGYMVHRKILEIESIVKNVNFTKKSLLDI